eukprot:CAMPEP_0198314836 /NCGR_PEP_ID=MMETSP1450-20131203/5327_1 /TAXON_ID=753684 ORGANISM="Madagascaria erythrocladiodes, Strain CCMP3234" /NCGR_SAMPLE_ID=MMETSP1450 /ASSEMBLY_ACC=CAM_ASM_001115 /LENGTH=227 /DNA_ID=CAMNT_0044017917 /DNA_START=72 /DNA_END=755 /DNA_ORIENTATION=-
MGIEFRVDREESARQAEAARLERRAAARAAALGDATLAKLLLAALQRRIRRNEKLNAARGGSDAAEITVFHAQAPPAISLEDYLVRLMRYTCCSPVCFVSALLCLESAGETNAALRVDSLNAHRLLLTTVMIAAKFWDDTFFASSYYARVGGVPTSELNALELEFLVLADFRVCFSAERLRAYERRLVVEAAGEALPATPPLLLGTTDAREPVGDKVALVRPCVGVA